MHTRIAILSDATICDEVPKTDRFRCNDARKKLEKLGWWRVERGLGGKASRYEFSIENRDAILDQRIVKKDLRDGERIERRTRDKRRKHNVVRLPHKSQALRGDPTTEDVVKLPPVHLQAPSSQNIIETEEEARLSELAREDQWWLASTQGPGERAS